MELALLVFVLIGVFTGIGGENTNHLPQHGRDIGDTPFDIQKLRRALENHDLNILLSNSTTLPNHQHEMLKQMRNNFIQKKDTVLSSLEGQCFLDSAKFFDDFASSLYTLLVLDAYGRPESGAFFGNLQWVGEFDLCTMIDLPTSDLTRFKGKHCSVNFLQPSVSNTTIYQEGVCIPDSCDSRVSEIYASVFLTILGIFGPEVVSASCFEELDYSAGDIAAIVILSLFGLLSLIGTALDVSFKQKNLKNNLMAGFFISFSWIANGKKLLSAKSSSGQLSCLNGLRTISMFWVILGHTVFFPLFVNTQNILYLVSQMTSTFEFQAIMNADFCVDTFFFLSGLLVSYLTLKALKKMPTSRVKFWGLFYFHRIWRLTPVYMLILMFFSTLFLHIPRGPRGRYYDEITKPCEEYWWTNLLYINNFHPGEGITTNTCMSWTWYMANDMQFYVLSPIVLLLFHHVWVVAIALCAVLVVACVIATGIYANEYQIYPDYVANDENARIELLIYIRPYFRCVPYLVGLIIGWTLVKFRKGIRMPWIVALIGWVFAGGSCMALIYGWLPYRDGSATINVDVGVAYFALKRLTWSVGVAWVTFACLNGYGGPVNWFLSWKIWIPLGRLTYCAYLIHPIMMFDYLLNMKKDFYMDGASAASFYLASLSATYALAVVVSLTLESPFMALEKLLLGRPSRERKESQHRENAGDKEQFEPDQKPTINGGPMVYINGGFSSPEYHGNEQIIQSKDTDAASKATVNNMSGVAYVPYCERDRPKEISEQQDPTQFHKTHVSHFGGLGSLDAEPQNSIAEIESQNSLQLNADVERF